MKLITECTVGIVGMGLMGGAITGALVNRCGVSARNVYACDNDSETLALASEVGLIGKGWPAEEAGEMLAACDLVFLCILPGSVVQFLEKWEHAFKPGTLITDCAGNKQSIAAAAEKLRQDVDFIPGHPMAGAEKGGFANAGLVNFIGKNYILCPLSRNKPENSQFLKNLIGQMGFGRITETSAAEHDSKIAFTSQLCHVIASALINCEADIGIVRFGGGSFEDFTRIAMIDASMWTELFVSNRQELLKRIDQFENSLAVLKGFVQEGNKKELMQYLAEVRNRRIAIDNLSSVPLDSGV